MSGPPAEITAEYDTPEGRRMDLRHPDGREERGVPADSVEVDDRPTLADVAAIGKQVAGLAEIMAKLPEALKPAPVATPEPTPDPFAERRMALEEKRAVLESLRAKGEAAIHEQQLVKIRDEQRAALADAEAAETRKAADVARAQRLEELDAGHVTRMQAMDEVLTSLGPRVAEIVAQNAAGLASSQATSRETAAAFQAGIQAFGAVFGSGLTALRNEMKEAIGGMGQVIGGMREVIAGLRSDLLAAQTQAGNAAGEREYEIVERAADGRGKRFVTRQRRAD